MKPLTKKRFEKILEKVFTTPVPELAGKREVGQVKKQTLESRPSDGYSGKRKSRGKTEGKED